jgi:hypothetical protein
MRLRVAWALLAALAAWAIYGFVHERLLSQEIWNEEGRVRLLGYTVVFWAVAGVFLWLRPDWLSAFAAGFAFVYSTWWCWKFYDPLAPLAVLYFLGSAYFLGRIVLRTLTPAVDGIQATLVGLACWILLISIAVHFPVNRSWIYVIALGIPYGFGSSLRPFVSKTKAWPRTTAVLLFVLGIHWLIALKPEVSSDGLAMHLAIPMMIAHDGRFAFDFHQYTWALTPINGDMAFTGAYLLGGEAAARLLNYALMVLIVAMVYRGSRRWLSASRAMLAAALFASTPLVELVTGSLFVENVWAVMIVGAAMALWNENLVGAGILLGSALASKVGTSAFLLPAVVATVVIGRKQARTAALAGAGFLLFAAPPYVNAWMQTGNPVFPFANGIFKSPDFEQGNAFANLPYQHAGTWNALYAITFRSHGFFEGRDGGFGFQYFLLAPLLLLLWNRRAPHVPLALGLTGAILTFASLPNIRYLYPALPLLSIGIAWLISECPALLSALPVVIALNLWFLPTAGWYHDGFALFTRPQWVEYLKLSAPERKLVENLNRTAPGKPVAFLQGAVIAGLNARGYSDTWHTYTFWKRMIESSDADGVAALFRELEIHYLLTPMPVATDYPVVQHFVEQWTAPSGISYGRFELRNVLATPLGPPPNTVPAGPGGYDDLDPKIEYTGVWLHDRQFSGPSSGSITYSQHPGDSARLFFDGRTITYVYTKALNRGTADVLIDRRLQAQVDEYASGIQWSQKMVFNGLKPGPHTIEIRVAGRKNPSSSGLYVDVDRLIVEK